VPHPALLVRGDVRDADLLRDALVDLGADAIVHMAALAEVGESVAFPERYREVNVAGTAAVIAAAGAAAVRRLVFSSTAAVYGVPDRVPIYEDDRLAPTNPYGETKLAGERLLADAADAGDLSFVALRYFNACGADGERGEDHEPESHLVPLALRAAATGAELRVFGDDYPTADGTCVRDYVHVADLADAHVLALEGMPVIRGIFNLGTGAGDSVLKVLGTVEDVTGRPVRRLAAPRRAGDPPALVASSGRVRASMGWRPRHTLADAVGDAWAWMRSHTAGYGDGSRS
jgi:UDP-glucose-4-epimerase GalE